MKRFICLILTWMLLLCACGPAGEEPTETTTEPTETTESVSELLQHLRQNLPRMDGSTSLIPLEAGIRAAIFDISPEEATAQVSHSSTWQSFQNLLEGNVDLIFSVDLSQDQLNRAAQAGVQLATIPIAKEGFVFVVNADNPVEVLTQSQLRGIYSGEITNWSQVGGNDEPIIAYQRNYDSGSQNYMTAFMGDTPLMDAPTELRPATMAGLMDVIAINDNSAGAIGYSVYAYAADMYGNGNQIKFIEVDGVAPSKAAFADGSYPLLGYNYAVYRADEPADGPVLKLVSWLLSREGQTAIADAGYVTVTDIGYDYTEAVLERYDGTGTGAPAADPVSSEFAAHAVKHYDYGDSYDSVIIPQVVTRSDGTQTYRLDLLTDRKLQDEINAWIDQQMRWAAEERPALEAMLDKLNSSYSYDWDVFTYGNYGYRQPEGTDAACLVTAKNGYLSVAVTMNYTASGFFGDVKAYRTETATWNLLTGQWVDIEELFCKNVDIDAVLNQYIYRYSNEQGDDFSSAPEMKQDFAGLPTSGWHMTIDSIYIDCDNPYFAHGEIITLDQLPDGVMVTEQPQDFTNCISHKDAVVVEQFRISSRDRVYAHIGDSYRSYRLVNEEAYPEAVQINAYVRDYVTNYYSDEAIRKYYTDLGYNADEVDMYSSEWYLEIWGGRYLFYYTFPIEYYDQQNQEFIYYPCQSWILYDLKTRTHISWEDLLKDGWEEAATWQDGLVPDDYSNMTVDWINLDNGHTLQVRFTADHRTYYYLSIPTDYLIY